MLGLYYSKSLFHHCDDKYHGLLSLKIVYPRVVKLLQIMCSASVSP